MYVSELLKKINLIHLEKIYFNFCEIIDFSYYIRLNVQQTDVKYFRLESIILQNQIIRTRT